MMKRFLLVLFFFGVVNTYPVHAQIIPEGGLFGMPSDDDSGEEPPLQLPEMPEAEQDQKSPQIRPTMQNSVAGYFPALPPSRLCTKNDIAGFWRLSMVYESPTGVELTDFSANPFQYVLFNNDSTFSIYKSTQSEKADAEVLKSMRAKKGGVLEQFVMHESGVLYFYKDGVAYDSLACFIVANRLDPFNVGQMLFMPPPDKATIRMVKVYQKVYSAPAETKKKTRKKKRRR